MAKKEVLIEGDFLVCSGKPLTYKAYAKPVRKGLSMLEAIRDRGYMSAAYLHPDDEDKSKMIGTVESMYLLDADDKAPNNTHAAYPRVMSKVIKGSPRMLNSLSKGVYGLSVEYTIDTDNLEYDKDGNIVVEDYNATYQNIALVPNPRHSVADIDMQTGRLISGNLFDSDDVDPSEIFFVVTDTNVYLHDAENSAIIYSKNNNTSPVEQVMSLIKAGVVDLFNKFNDKQEVIPVNKEEFQEVLNTTLDKKFDEKLASHVQALKDSADTVTTTEKEAKDFKEQLELAKKEVIELKDSNDELKKNLVEKEALIQTMSQSLSDASEDDKKKDADKKKKDEEDKKNKDEGKSKSMKDSGDLDTTYLDKF